MSITQPPLQLLLSCTLCGCARTRPVQRPRQAGLHFRTQQTHIHIAPHLGIGTRPRDASTGLA